MAASRLSVTLLSNASASGSAVEWPGGDGRLEVRDTFGGASVSLQVLNVTASTWHYYEASLDNGSTTVITLFFRTYGSTATDAIVGQDPDRTVVCKALGVDWCAFIIPRSRNVQSVLNAVKSEASTKVPFGYVTYIADKISTVNITNSDLGLTLPLGSNHGTAITIPVNVAAVSAPITSQVRPWLVATVWIVFVASLVGQVIGKKPEA